MPVLLTNGTLPLMRPPYFHMVKTVMVYISLDRQLKMLFVDISFTKIGKLTTV